MKKSKVGYLIIAFLSAWVLAHFFFLPAICSAEPAYMITEAELTTLEQNSNRQLAISSQLAAELQTAGNSYEYRNRNRPKQEANRTTAESVVRAGSLVEESRRLAAANTEILATIRSRGIAGDRSQD